MKTLSIITRSTPPCGECIRVKMELEDGGVPFTEVDISINPEAVEEYGVMSVPVLLFKEEDGEIFERVTGYQHTSSIKTLLED